MLQPELKSITCPLPARCLLVPLIELCSCACMQLINGQHMVVQVHKWTPPVPLMHTLKVRPPHPPPPLPLAQNTLLHSILDWICC